MPRPETATLFQIRELKEQLKQATDPAEIARLQEKIRKLEESLSESKD